MDTFDALGYDKPKTFLGMKKLVKKKMLNMRFFLVQMVGY